MRKLFLLPFALAAAAPAAAKPVAAVPRLDVAQTCRAAAKLDLTDGQTFNSCMGDETEAKTELAKNWTSYSAAARSRCTAETMIGGNPSYVELFECLDINKDLSQPPARTASK
jgi:hypothetical protein